MDTATLKPQDGVLSMIDDRTGRRLFGATRLADVARMAERKGWLYVKNSRGQFVMVPK